MTLHKFPSLATSFLGRDTELDELSKLLVDPSCHLLTLIGLGGIGKTRLAIELTRRVEGVFPDGVYFVPLQPVSSAEQILHTLITVLNVNAVQDPRDDLFSFLEEKQSLLLMDNFEHVLDGAELVADILHHAPDVKLLVTSREALKLQEEWQRQVSGLTYPEVVKEHDHYSAVDLFMTRAQRLRGNLDFEAQYEDVVQICQLVEGMPLALELAAGWVTVLSCKEIADELQCNQAVLSARASNTPERHSSMQEVFDHSWRLLSEQEQQVMRCFSVFRGGCTREAAEQVTGATLPILAGLVDKSLLRHDPESGRYNIQELQRQYAAERLEDSHEVDDVRNLHSAYYAHAIHNLLQENHRKMFGMGLDSIVADFENLRMAWYRALECDDYGTIDKLVEPIWHYVANRGSGQTALTLYEAAVGKLVHPENDDDRAILGRVLSRLSKSYTSSFSWEQAYRTSLQSLEIARSINSDIDANYALQSLTQVLRCMGRYEQAWNYGQELLALSRKLNIVTGLGLGRHAESASATGRIEESRQLIQEALDIAPHARAFFRPFSHWHYGVWALRNGDWKVAQVHLEQSRQLFLEWNHKSGDRLASIFEAQVALAIGDLEEAQQIAESVYQLIDNNEVMTMVATIVMTPWTLSMVASARDDHDEAILLAASALEKTELVGGIFVIAPAKFALGWANLGLEEYTSALNYLLDSFESVLTWQATAYIAYHLAAFACVFAAQGEFNRAVELIGLVLTHPNSPRGYLERHLGMGRLRNELETQLGTETYTAAWERGTQLDILDVGRELLHEFIPEEATHIPEVNQTLDNPLTQRELEVLLLMAEKLTNPQIADRLFITNGTVKGHVNKILHKLSVTSREEAVVQATALQLLNP